MKTREHFQKQQIHLPGKRNAVEIGLTCLLNTTWYLVTQHSGLRGRQENYNSRKEQFKFVKDENRRSCVMFADPHSAKTRKPPRKFQDRMMVYPRMVQLL